MKYNRWLCLFAALLWMTAALTGCSAPAPAATQQPVPEATQEPTQEPTQAPQATMEPAPKLSVEEYPKVDGSTATIPLAVSLMQKITGADEAQAEEATIFTTTDPSYEAMLQGDADLLLVYEAADSTKKELKGYDTLQLQPIGRDALVFIVNEDNPVESLTTEQIRDIYSGKITNWKEVGGNDQEIKAFQRPDKSGSQTLIKKLVMQGTEMMDAPTEMVPYGMDDIIEAISSFSAEGNALGYSVYYYAKNMYAQPGLKMIAVDGVMPGNDTIRAAEYPYLNDFFGVLPAEPTKEAKTVLDWLLTPAGQALIEECGYVAVR